MSCKGLKPRKVDDKAFRRWLKGAFLLMNRNKFTWFVLSFSCAIVAIGTGNSQFLQYMSVLALFFVGIVFASTVDTKESTSLYQQFLALKGSLSTAILVSGYTVTLWLVVLLIFNLITGDLPNVTKTVFNPDHFYNIECMISIKIHKSRVKAP